MSKNLSLSTVIRELQKLYNPPKSFLNHRTHLDLLVATILSAQCTDKVVNEVTKSLFKKYRKAEDYTKVSRKELEKDIRSCGTFRNKAKFIQKSCEVIVEKHGNRVPNTMKELTALPGVGRKTAAIILYVAFDKCDGIAVDTHVMRLAKRLGLTKAKAQNAIEKDLMRQIPRKEWGKANPLLISHGRKVCIARSPQCGKCVFRKKCPSFVSLVDSDI